MIEKGKRVRTRFLDVRALPSPLSHPRVAVVVPKQGHTAVQRNKVKRRIRELIRIYILPTAGAVDVVFRARRDAYSASFMDFHGDLVTVAHRLVQALKETE